jgi:predicted CXXCH cytochrome family protein
MTIKERFERLILAMMVALLVAAITLVIAQAQEGTPNQPAAPEVECTVCHTEFQMVWMNGPHGQAGSDPVFQQQWAAQGKPGACLVCHTTGYDPASGTWKSDNVSCEACHGPISPDHPKSPMPVDRSQNLCARCHSDTRFGWQEWQGSTHYQRGMDCITCHDPHSASIKIVGTSQQNRDVSQLCINCHKETSMGFSYTIHYQKGVSCVDCHLKHTETEERAAHTIPDHSFNASLATCNTCHATQMHQPGDASTPSEDTNQPNPPIMPLMQTSSLSPEPEPVSPIGYATLAGLVGLAAGMILAPWLEKFYRRLTRHN